VRALGLDGDALASAFGQRVFRARRPAPRR
jgi:hypothetical protein